MGFLDRQDRRGPARKPSIRGRRFLGRGELAFLVSIPVIAAVLYVLTQQFPALLGPAPGPVLRDPAPMGTGPYAFMATTSGGQPVTYSSCRPINYVVNPMHRHSLYYLALILLVIGVTTNLIARLIARRYTGARA